MKLTGLDANEIPRYTYDDDTRSIRVTVVDGSMPTFNVAAPENKPQEITVPAVQRIEVPVIIKELEVKTVEVPVITVETKVVVKEQKPSVQDTPEVVDGDQPLVGK